MAVLDAVPVTTGADFHPQPAPHLHARAPGTQRCDCGLPLPLYVPSSFCSPAAIRKANAELAARLELTDARTLRCLTLLEVKREEAFARQGWQDIDCTVREAHGCYEVLSPKGRVLWSGEACCPLCARVNGFECASVAERLGGTL